MGLTRLGSFLGRHRSIAIDTNIFIYALEANPRYAAFADHVFSWLEQAGHRGVTSTITMTELMVQPYRAGDEQRVNELYGLLATYPNLDWIAPDLEIADTGGADSSHVRAADAGFSASRDRRPVPRDGFCNQRSRF